MDETKKRLQAAEAAVDAAGQAVRETEERVRATDAELAAIRGEIEETGGEDDETLAVLAQRQAALLARKDALTARLEERRRVATEARQTLSEAQVEHQRLLCGQYLEEARRGDDELDRQLLRFINDVAGKVARIRKLVAAASAASGTLLGFGQHRVRAAAMETDPVEFLLVRIPEVFREEQRRQRRPPDEREVPSETEAGTTSEA